jgi:long-chain acyl-CoA synthetase
VLGGRSVPVYQDAIAKELAFVLNHAEVSVVVAEDQEQVDKILALKEQLPKLRLVIYDDPRGMVHYKADWLKSFTDVQALGRERAGQRAEAFASEIERGRPEDIALICYTSGTTGNPRAPCSPTRTLISVARTFAGSRRSVHRRLPRVSPMAWVGDALYSMVVSLAVGFCMNCPESPETGAARPPRARSHRAARAAPHLGEHADRGAGAGD